MLHIGFIGTGGVAERHAEALCEMPEVKLVAAWSRSAAPREAFATRYGATARATLRELLDDPAIDAVFVLSKADTHVDYAIEALAARLRRSVSLVW
jgi:predicted dehydrogenase